MFHVKQPEEEGSAQRAGNRGMFHVKPGRGSAAKGSFHVKREHERRPNAQHTGLLASENRTVVACQNDSPEQTRFLVHVKGTDAAETRLLSLVKSSWPAKLS
jgi:hypothetical protein